MHSGPSLMCSTSPKLHPRSDVDACVKGTHLRKSVNFGRWQDRRRVDTVSITAKRSAPLNLGAGSLGVAGVAATAAAAPEETGQDLLIQRITGLAFCLPR